MIPSGILTATWYIHMYWELFGGDMSVSKSSMSWVDTWYAGYSVQYWGLPGGVMSDTGTLFTKGM